MKDKHITSLSPMTRLELLNANESKIRRNLRFSSSIPVSPFELTTAAFQCWRLMAVIFPSVFCFVLCFFLFLLFFLFFEDQKLLPLPKIRKIRFYFNVRMRERYYHWCGRYGRCSAHWREAFGDFLENPLPAALQGPFMPHPQSLPFTELYRTSGMAVLIPRATRF